MNIIGFEKKKGFYRSWKACFDNLTVIYKKIWKGSKFYFLSNFFMIILRAYHPFNSIIFLSLIIQELIGNQIWRVAIVYAVLFCVIELFFRGIEIVYVNYEEYKIEQIKTKFLYEIEEKTMTLPYQILDSAETINNREKAMEVFFPTQAQFMDIRNSIVCGSLLLSNILQLIGVISILSKLNLVIVLSIIIICFVSAVLSSFAGNKEFELWDKTLVTIGRRLGYFQNISTDFAFAKEMRINQLGQWIVDKMKDVTQSLVGSIEKTTRVFTLTSSISNILLIILNGAIYIYLGSLVLGHIINIAELNVYIGSIATMIGALLGISSCLITIKKSGTYIQTYLDYINMNVTFNQTQTCPAVDEHFVLELKDVWFCYPGQEDFILKGINLIIKKNTKLAIVGDNGAGKTTLIKLIMRMYIPTKGCILLNDVDINEIPQVEYMKHIASVDQDFQILNYSMVENIKFDQVQKESFEGVLKEVGLDSVVEAWPKGVDTVLSKLFDQDGIELSAGQQQKVAIARALCKEETELIILDEPTAMLSPMMEHEIYMNFARLVQKRTAIYISHRMSSCQFCDNIVVLEDGKVIEYGTHASLMEKEGLYHKFYTLQAEFYKSM